MFLPNMKYSVTRAGEGERVRVISDHLLEKHGVQIRCNVRFYSINVDKKESLGT